MYLIKTSSSDNINNNINPINNQPIYDDIFNYKFDYEAKLGEGRFGKVRLAFHKLTNEKVAIKVIDKNQIKLKEQRQRIDTEISILKLLNHHNISKIYSIIENEERIYLIQEYIKGNDLNFFINKKEKPIIREQIICNYFRQIISAIEYLHKLGISHRDLKPENILINRKNEIKLIDFGLSKTFSKGELLKTPCGSPFYAAPEMVKGKKYNGINTDIWSIGIILYLMLFQELPFMDADVNRLYKKILKGKYEIPEDKINLVSKEAIDLVQKILEINPKKRININGIKNHIWFNKISNELYEGINIKEIVLPIDEEIVEEINSLYGYDKMRIRNTIIRNLYNNIRSLYSILLEKKINKGKESIADLYSKLYIDYINDEKNKLSYYDNNIENVLKDRMKSKGKLDIVNDYEENKEFKKRINSNKNILILDENNNLKKNINKSSFVKNIKKNKNFYLNKNRNKEKTQYFSIKNNSCHEKLMRMKTNDFPEEANIKKRISENVKIQINISGNLNVNSLEDDKKIYSERHINDLGHQRYNSSQNNYILSKFNSSSVDKKKKISNYINNNINVNKRKENNNINHKYKKNYLSVSYDKPQKNINKSKTNQIFYNKNNKEENKDKVNKEKKDKDLFDINRHILEKIHLIKRNQNTLYLNNKKIKNDSLLSPNNKSTDISNKNYNKKLSFNKNIKKTSNKNLSSL